MLDPVFTIPVRILPGNRTRIDIPENGLAIVGIAGERVGAIATEQDTVFHYPVFVSRVGQAHVDGVHGSTGPAVPHPYHLGLRHGQRPRAVFDERGAQRRFTVRQVGEIARQITEVVHKRHFDA